MIGMSATGQLIMIVIFIVVCAAVVIHLWPDMQPLIQNISGGDGMSLIKSLIP